MMSRPPGPSQWERARMSQDDVVARAGAALAHAIFAASDLVFGPWTIAMLFGAGSFLTLRLRLVQLVHWREVLASSRRAPSEGGGALSPFQAFTTALTTTPFTQPNSIAVVLHS